MAEDRTRQEHDLNLSKLGIREIHERIEVSPILTDPGTTLTGTDPAPTPKSYVCNIEMAALPLIKP